MKAIDTFDTQMGAKIKVLRESLGISQSDLAKELKFETPTAISLIESGKRSLKLRDFKKISDYFNVSYEYLIGDQVKDIIEESLEDEIARAMTKLAALMKKQV